MRYSGQQVNVKRYITKSFTENGQPVAWKTERLISVIFKTSKRRLHGFNVIYFKTKCRVTLFLTCV